MGYYRRFIANFTNISSPLFKLLVKYVYFCWHQYCPLFFETLKVELSLAPVLRGPNWSLHFHIYTDVSENSLGGVLEQKDNQDYYAIYFINKNLTPAQLDYIVTEKELWAVVHSINKFRHYITGYDVFVHTDHYAIRLLMNKYITSGRVTWWLLLV